MEITLVALRYAVFGVFVGAAGIALGSWALREGRISRFGRLARLIRGASEPVLQPIELWQLRRGGNPQNAPWWLVGVAVAGGILLLTGAEWILRAFASVSAAASAGPRGILRLLVFAAGQVVIWALIIRVVGSWFGAGRFNKWIGWTYKVTDWIVEPLRRIIPPIGIIDITPLVAWFLMQFLLGVILQFI
jgi:YggT family protein